MSNALAEFSRTTVLGIIVRVLINDSLRPLLGKRVADSGSLTNRSRDIQVGSQGPLDHTGNQKQVEVDDWNSQTDPENPQNWTTLKKTFVTVVICLYTFTVYCGSSIYVPATRQVMEIYHVSETKASLGLAIYVLGYGLGPLLFSPLSEIYFIGRNPVYFGTFILFAAFTALTAIVENFTGFIILRFLQAFFGSPCLATGAASLGDMFSIVKIPYPLAAWSGAMYAGPALGPLLSGFTVASESWRWSMWETLWLSALILVLLLACLPETSASTLLYWKAKRLRKASGNTISATKGTTNRKDLNIAQIVKFALVKPFEISIKDPAIAFTHVYMCLLYGIYYSFFEAFALVYTPIYHFNLGETGLAFLCILLACGIGIATYCIFYRTVQEAKMRSQDATNKHEDFLRPGLYGVFGVPAGLFLFGWAARSNVPWPVPTLGIVIYCSCSFVVGLGIFIYLPLSYPRYAASLFAANDALRSAFAAGAVLFGRPLYSNLGIGKGCSLLGGLSILGIIGFWYLYIYGEKLRRRSRFAVSSTS